MRELQRRRRDTAGRIAKLRGCLKDSEALARGKASVFATGSFGRGEASRYSDLDLFIVGKKDGEPGPNGVEGSLLKKLDEICIKADLVSTTRRLGIREFSGDGRYLTHFSVHEFTKTLGTPEDDVTNTFTARLLLLLESQPLLEPAVYSSVIREVVDAYWRDFKGREANFIPAFLANDVLRLWRTFCVNYEARTKRVPAREKAKGKLKNYKLKHSRLLTCYSALLYLLAVYRTRKTVTPNDAIHMIGLTPTARLEWLLSLRQLSATHGRIKELLDQYERFLETTNASDETLLGKFANVKTSKDFLSGAYHFGDLVFEVLTSIGSGNRFHRLLVV